MYKTYPSLVLGFHACDKSIGEKVFSGVARLKRSNNKYDWLGHGVYFWENSPHRAVQWGAMQKRRGKVTKPCVVGAVIALGRCFDLLEYDSLRALRQAYDTMRRAYQTAGLEEKIPRNESHSGSEELLLRVLDCAVLEFMHSETEKNSSIVGRVEPYDSVRGVFWEGEALYPGAGFKQKNHVQLCVRNPNCIKGYFRVLDPDQEHRRP